MKFLTITSQSELNKAISDGITKIHVKGKWDTLFIKNGWFLHYLNISGIVKNIKVGEVVVRNHKLTYPVKPATINNMTIKSCSLVENVFIDGVIKNVLSINTKLERLDVNYKAFVESVEIHGDTPTSLCFGMRAYGNGNPSPVGHVYIDQEVNHSNDWSSGGA